MTTTDLQKAASIMGQKGGPAAARKLTPEQRVARAKKAGAASGLARQKQENSNEDNG
jgi:hypothetical protein